MPLTRRGTGSSSASLNKVDCDVEIPWLMLFLPIKPSLEEEEEEEKEIVPAYH